MGNSVAGVCNYRKIETLVSRGSYFYYDCQATEKMALVRDVTSGSHSSLHCLVYGLIYEKEFSSATYMSHLELCSVAEQGLQEYHYSHKYLPTVTSTYRLGVAQEEFFLECLQSEVTSIAGN